MSMMRVTCENFYRFWRNAVVSVKLLSCTCWFKRNVQRFCAQRGREKSLALLVKSRAHIKCDWPCI